jgi:hypothetical protein
MFTSQTFKLLDIILWVRMVSFLYVYYISIALFITYTYSKALYNTYTSPYNILLYIPAYVAPFSDPWGHTPVIQCDQDHIFLIRQSSPSIS